MLKMMFSSQLLDGHLTARHHGSPSQTRIRCVFRMDSLQKKAAAPVVTEHPQCVWTDFMIRNMEK